MAFVAFLFYLVFVFVRPHEFMTGIQALPVVKWSLICVAVFLLFEKNKRFDGPHTYLLLAFLVVIFLSSVFNGWIGGGIIDVETTLTTAVLPFFVIMNVVNSHRKQLVTMFVLIVAALIMLSNGISQISAEDGMGWAGVALKSGRITYLGIMNDPNDLSMFFVMTLPLAVYLFSHSKNVFRYFFMIAALMILYGVFLTNSRGGLLAVIALLGFWFLLKYGVWKTAALAAVALPVLAIVVGQFRTIDPDEASAYGRLEAWYQGYQMLKHNPLFGVGQGAFADHHFLTAHNSMVLVFAELGLLGYFCWTGFLVFCGLGVLSLWSRKVGSPVVERIGEVDRAMAKCLTFSLLGFLASGFFLSRSYSPILYVFCGLMIATFYRAVPATEAGSFFNLRTYFRPFVAIYLGSMVGIYLLVKVLV